MKNYLLSLGSNIDPHINLPKCSELLNKKFDNVKISSYYETDPVGPSGDNLFWNAAALIQSHKTRKTLSEEIRKIEAELGRIRDPKNKFIPRTIDIDILPQPSYQTQGFIVIPLCEILPEMKDEETGLSFLELTARLDDSERKACRKIS